MRFAKYFYVLGPIIFFSSCSSAISVNNNNEYHIGNLEKASQISSDLENYIYNFFNGDSPKRIPDAILPKGINLKQNNGFYIQKFEELNPENQWAVRYASPINLQKVQSGVPDPHSTYLLLGTVLAPFGTKVVIEGEFPYCRFFSLQVSPPFDGKSFCANRVMGPTEVSIADVDIDPIPGNVNPFRIGQNRNAVNRKYRIEIELAMGNPVDLNPDFEPPYVNNDNRLFGAFIQNQGPEYKTLSGKGPWNMGALWLRYYAPDLDKGPDAGVELPKIHYELPDGTKYFINSDYSVMLEDANFEQPAVATRPIEPTRPIGPDKGWYKSFGILRSSLEGVYQLNGWISKANMAKVRAYDLRATGRGEFEPAPGNYEPSATGNNYATYIGRGMNLGDDKVVVLTGKLPTFPDTRKGMASMVPAQLRYFSITGYDVSLFRPTLGSAIHSVMDDEIVINNNREYVIVYSRSSERPKNALKENGVTWVDWGPTSDLSLMLRWVSVSPHWEMSPNPHELELPYAIADLAGSNYQDSLLGVNDQKGHLGNYLPRVHYMGREQFEALGPNLITKNIPIWHKLHGNGN